MDVVKGTREKKNMSAGAEAGMEGKRITPKKTADAAAERDVAAMERRRRSSFLEKPLTEVMEEYPGLRELLRDRGIRCEGCQLLYMATLEEVFRCYRIDGDAIFKELNQGLK